MTYLYVAGTIPRFWLKENLRILNKSCDLGTKVGRGQQFLMFDNNKILRFWANLQKIFTYTKCSLVPRPKPGSVGLGMTYRKCTKRCKDDGSMSLPLLIQTFLRNFVGILTKNFTPVADSTS